MADQDPRATAKCPFNFDHDSAEHAQNWPAEFRQMRAECPVAWTEAHGGYWVASRYAEVVKMAQDHATFSSRKTFNPETKSYEGGISFPVIPNPPAVPIEADPPVSTEYRQYFNPQFGPKSAEERRSEIRGYVSGLIDRVIETGEMDLVNDLTSPVPALATMALIGLPLGEWREIADATHESIYVPKNDPHYPEISKRMEWVFGRCVQELADRRKSPRDDMLSHFITEKIGDRYLTDDEIISFCVVLINGGVDTTTALTSNALFYLYEHPEEKQRLLDDPNLLRFACEEFVRFFSPVHSLARRATRDVEIGGASIQKGDHVLLAWSAANRDPAVFENPEEIVLDRYPNRHIGFGAGSHRCVGSFLARVMFEEVITQVLTRIPDYRIDVAKARRYTSVGLMNGWIDMPATFTPGPKVGVELAF